MKIIPISNMLAFGSTPVLKIVYRCSTSTPVLVHCPNRDSRCHLFYFLLQGSSNNSSKTSITVAALEVIVHSPQSAVHSTPLDGGAKGNPTNSHSVSGTHSSASRTAILACERGESHFARVRVSRYVDTSSLLKPPLHPPPPPPTTTANTVV